MTGQTKKYSCRFVYAALILVTFTVFNQVLNNEFVYFDDQQYITENPHIQNVPISQGIKWAFTTAYAANWHPLTWLSHILDYKLFGLNPTGHHLTNLLLHIANTLLLFAVLNAMTGALWRSAFVAALFALHPLHVESVAWAAERKDVLSTFFWLLTMAGYLRYTRIPNAGSYLLTLALFAFGLMAKPMLVTLPFVLLLLDYWPLNRLNINDRSQIYSRTYEKIPFFVLSAISSIVTLIVQQQSITDVETLYPSERIANAVVCYIIYIEKMLVPRKLAVLYPLAGNLPTAWSTIAAAIILLVISVLVIRFSSKHRYLLVGWLWFIGTLVPVIGLIQVGTQQIADRYTYVPLTGLFIAITWSAADVLSSWKYRKTFLTAAAAVVIASLSICTILQLRYWRNSISLFERAVAVTNNNYICYNNLGFVLAARRNFEQALPFYKQSLAIKPDYPVACNNLGAAYNELGRYEEAIPLFKETIRIKPDDALAYNNLGTAYLHLRRCEDVIELSRQAVENLPDCPMIYSNLGAAYQMLGRYPEAIANYKLAIKLKPDYFEAHYNLGIAYTETAQWTQAIASYNHAIRIKPDLAAAHFNLGVTFLTTGDKNSALAECEILKKLDKEKANALFELINK